MFCGPKEQETCEVEKLGCEGCHYFNDKNKEDFKMRNFEYVNRVLSTGYEMKEPNFNLPVRKTKKSRTN